MRESKRKALEAAGWVSGDAEDFLGLDDAEREIVALRVEVSRRVREIRAERRLTQSAVAKMLDATQPFVSALENAGVGLSLEAMLGALLRLGGTLQEVVPNISPASLAPVEAHGHPRAAHATDLPAGRRPKKVEHRPAKKRRVPSN